MYTVANVMMSPVITVAPEATVSAAMKEMKRNEISSLIVALPDSNFGILTQRDVIGKVVAAGLDTQSVTVGQICTSPIATIGPGTSLRECSARMMDLKVRRLPVVDEQGQLLGIITETDIFVAVEERGWGPDQLGESKLRSIGALARLRRMRVEDVMSKPVAMIAQNARVSDALARMAERGISSIIVMPQAESRVYGIVTKRDIIAKVVARNRDPQSLSVSEIMSSPIYTIAPHVTLPQCAARMVALGVRRLTVTAGEQPVGIISDTDIFRAGQGRRVAPHDRGPAGPRPQIRHITRSQVHAAADVMDRDVLSVPFETTVSQALATMEANNVISLLVEPAERGGELGIVTQRDVVSKVVAQEQDPDTVTVGEISSSPLFTVSPQTPIAECSDLMAQRNIRRLPVREHGKIVGIVSDTDIFAAVEERGWEAELDILQPAADIQIDRDAVVAVEEFVEVVTEPNAKSAQAKKVVGSKRTVANGLKRKKAPPRKARPKSASRKPAPKKRR
jgi:signal-transduction protein with cAMP-binding, CBS, and nucleotidyltransferase domain